MKAERDFRSVSELFQATRTSASLGEKRDSISDSEQLLKIFDIKPELKFEQSRISDKPTLVAANHYCRQLLQREFSFPGSLITTQESMITASIASIGARDLNQKGIVWFVESDPADKFLSFKLEDRVTQQAMIECYDSIPVSRRNPSIAVYRMAVSALRFGKNIGIFPEGRGSRRLREHHRGFEGLITMIKQKVPDFQILPVSISYSKGRHSAIFGEVIDPQEESGNVAQKTMYKISQNLPPNLRGNY